MGGESRYQIKILSNSPQNLGFKEYTANEKYRLQVAQ